MRQLILIAGILAILMYGTVASQQGVPVSAAPTGAGLRAPAGGGLSKLQKALGATGARLDEVQITGWTPVDGDSARQRLLTGLGPAPAGEERTAALRKQDDQSYVVVRVTLTGKAVTGWQARVQAVQKALDSVAAGTTSISVQLGGVAPDGSLTGLAAQALGALSATDRQPWSDQRAASLAGKTTDLPPSPYGVNVQVAVRRDAARGQTHVWVAWPALQQEY